MLDHIIGALMAFFERFKNVMIEGDRYEFLIDGLKNTFTITFGALAIGIVIGIIIAAIRTSFDKNRESMKLRGGIGYYILAVLNAIGKFYITVVRGIPVVVQLMICYFVIFASADNGIMSIDHGQFEAGRSLGFNYFQTMRFIVIPQMFKAVLPTLCNEFIALLKETSVAGYVGVIDLTKAGNTIAGRTFEYFIPLLTVAVIYLVLVVILTNLVGRLERRLRKSDR